MATLLLNQTISVNHNALYGAMIDPELIALKLQVTQNG